LDSGDYECSYLVAGKTASYKIDLSQANLPILGNTEKVANSQNQTEEFDDAVKTNEYVSWYLNGVNGRAENEPLADNEESLRKIIDFSGPIKKLLPQSIQYKNQIATIQKRESERHDQVVLCADEPLLGIGKTTPIPCYSGSGSGAQGNEYRLSAWDGNLSFFNTYINSIVGLFTSILPDVPRDTIRAYIGNPWNERIPPLPWDSQFENNSVLYLKAYNEWRGKSCLIIPTINKLVCIDNPFIKNKFADLFPYVPLSSTEDRVGEVSVDEQNVTAASEDLTISNVNLVTSPAELFFSHTEEIADLASLLQLTFAPSGAATTGAPSLVSPAESCDLQNVRTNEGDSLFATEITGSLAYDAEFSCVFDGSASASACTKNVSVGLGVVTQTPKADELWSRLVAGPAGIFKRIFPLVGEGGAIIGILDMPGATNVEYSGSGLVSAGNPEGRAGEDAELYFPHLGGISEYFLKGIQTILRPKGYGEPILSGAAGTFASSGDVDCNQSAASVSLPRTLNRQQTFQLALNWIGGQTGNHVLECYNDVVGRAKSSGVNAALTLLLWLNESNASNYGISPADFGIRALDNQGFNAQITRFLNLPSSYRSNYGSCFGRGNDTIAFLRLFRSGNCTDEAGLKYANGIVSKWNFVTSCPFPQSPTSTSCP
jgi:hypothetical protein